MTAGERAVQVWQVLVSAAHYRQTLTYALLAERIGLETHMLAQPLGMVAQYCAMRQLPPITVLVVQADAGRPARGFQWASDPDFAREAVYRHTWFRSPPPSSGDFALVEHYSTDEPLG
jgi:hypothetical protein